MLKLAKLLAVAAATLFLMFLLFLVRLAMEARAWQREENWQGPGAIDLHLLLHSTWLILGWFPLLALAGWISHRWIFKS